MPLCFQTDLGTAEGAAFQTWKHNVLQAARHSIPGARPQTALVLQAFSVAKAITRSRTGTNCRARHVRGSSKDKTGNREECICNLCPSTYFGFQYISHCLNLVQTNIWEGKKHVRNLWSTENKYWKGNIRTKRTEERSCLTRDLSK